jgi:hypothetical protein
MSKQHPNGPPYHDVGADLLENQSACVCGTESRKKKKTVSQLVYIVSKKISLLSSDKW